MYDRVDLLEQLLDVLLSQEGAMATLVQLAFEEQNAIVHSDYDAIHALSARMLAIADQLDKLDEKRVAITSRLGHFESLEALIPVADTLGVDGFGDAHERLLRQATQLREAQEQNARLILGAVKLRERWLALLAGLGSPTYGAGGQQEMQQQRGIVSRSA